MTGWCWQLPDGRWRIRWRTQSGRRPSETYRLEKDAEKALRDRISEAERGVDNIDRKATLAQFIPEWEASTKTAVKPRSWQSYDQHVRDWIVPELGSHRLQGIDQRVVQRFVDRLTAKGLAPKTVRGIHGTLSLILKAAASYGLAQSVMGVRLPKITREEIIVPTPLEVEQIATAIDARMWAIVRLCGYAGLRQGEALALRPGDIEWLQRRLRVSGSINLRTGARETPKNGKGRWVTMPTIIADTLSQHLHEYPASNYVFHRQDGRAWKASRVWEAWDTARKACKLEHVDFHHLRHGAASLMIASGWSAKRVQVELGHSDPAFTLRVYGHLFPDEFDTGRALLDAKIAEKLGETAVPHLSHDTATTSGNPLPQRD